MVKLQDYFREKTHIVWDWNGTLLDDVDFCIQTINEILVEHGLKQVSRDAYRERFAFPVVDYYKTLGFDFNKVSFEVVGKAFFDRYRAGLNKGSSLFEGTKDLLKSLKAEGKHLYILSAAEEQHLFEATRYFQVEHLFDGVYGISNVYATSKVDRGKELLQKIAALKEKIIFVGDTDHDLDVAKSLGIDALLIADGHQPYCKLKPLHNAVLESRYMK